MNESPLWLEGVAFPAADGPLPGRVDVAVIGAGYTGLAAAGELARRGATVAVLEGGRLGAGASARNGGMVLTGLKLDALALVARFGPERARQMFAASLDAIALVERIVRDEQIDCAFARAGHLVVAAKPSHVAALQHEADLLERDFGHPTTMLAPDELGQELGSSAFHGGLVDPASAALDPGRYLAGLALAARRAGAQLCENALVERISRAGPGYTLATAAGGLRAAAVFVASGGATGLSTPALQRRIVPLGSYIIATEPLPEALAREIIPRGRMAFDTRQLLSYFRLTPDRRLLFGGRAGFVPATPATIRESALILRRAMLTVFPQLQGAQVDYAWGGTVDVAFDLMPHAGQLDGLFYALGYAGHGVAMATYLGQRMAAVICGEPPDHPFDGLPFPQAPLGLYRGDPWFLPLAGLYYRFKDWVS